ncbi:GGDEF domain-containing protein [Mycobacterium sp. ITM-2016-00316]|uniref:GGDEF domain-containing protein n=1 Tax=Mycobacterium sp. ITM-2016-00316 TaxID=2099695 RepID=UPI000CFA5349|nr:GGDEF domain-containing protein [Mycobacterium sp. ITM-2016-00316]WNG81084.1 GGDEF domain-containing protein [Mycobacterium sp. ITM-2016-00316]
MTAPGPSRWLLRANHYEWITDYLVTRRMTGAVRVAMAMVAGSLALCLLALLNSVDGPRDAIPVAMMWTAFAGGVAGAVLWALTWPTRGQSLAFALVSNTSVALACLSYPNPQGGLTGCIAFATTAAYIAFFHGTVLVLYNFVLATVVALIVAVRVVDSGHVVLALVDIFLVLQVNIVMPFAIHVLVRALGVDLEQADRDPLTGLLNRRALQQHIVKMLAATDRAHLVVAVVDLDDFKHINDTYGHQAGDDALVAVGRALGHAVFDTTAVIGRIGGEEFVVAAACLSADPTLLSRRICKAIADLPVPVTASVGTSSAEVRTLAGDETTLRAKIEHLVMAADEAMYTAKRAGGNRFRHAS